PKLIGNAKAGKSAFTTTCAACHTLKAAGAVGNIGPNLDKTAKTLTEALIIKAITNGGAAGITQAGLAQYTNPEGAHQGPPPARHDQQHRRVRDHLASNESRPASRGRRLEAQPGFKAGGASRPPSFCGRTCPSRHVHFGRRPTSHLSVYRETHLPPLMP